MRKLIVALAVVSFCSLGMAKGGSHGSHSVTIGKTSTAKISTASLTKIKSIKAKKLK